MWLMSCAAVALVSPCRGCKLFDRHEIKAIGGIEMKLADLVADTITGHIRHNVIEDAGELAGEGFVYCCNAAAHHHSCLPYRASRTKREGGVEEICKRFGIFGWRSQVCISIHSVPALLPRPLRSHSSSLLRRS